MQEHISLKDIMLSQQLIHQGQLLILYLRLLNINFKKGTIRLFTQNGLTRSDTVHSVYLDNCSK